MTSNQSKLLLFDIDGTILSTKGVPRKAMKRVLERRFNNFTYDDDYNYSGRTDWQIVEHLLIHAKIDYPRDYQSLKVIFMEFAEDRFIFEFNSLSIKASFAICWQKG